MLNLIDSHPYRFNMSEAEQILDTENWLNHLYRNPDLEGRVVGVCHNIHDTVDLSVDHLIDFLLSRQTENCQPLLSCQVSGARDITLDRFSRISAGLGPSLRSLHVVAELSASFAELQTGIELLDKKRILA